MKCSLFWRNVCKLRYAYWKYVSANCFQRKGVYWAKQSNYQLPKGTDHFKITLFDSYFLCFLVSVIYDFSILFSCSIIHAIPSKIIHWHFRFHCIFAKMFPKNMWTCCCCCWHLLSKWNFISFVKIVCISVQHISNNRATETFFAFQWNTTFFFYFWLAKRIIIQRFNSISIELIFIPFDSVRSFFFTEKKFHVIKLNGFSFASRERERKNEAFSFNS